VNQLLEDLRSRLRPGETLTVVPFGVMINYLLRRPSSVPHWQFGPFDMIIYGEERLVAEFEARPPDYIVIPSIDLTEDGARSFEQDYAFRLSAWIRAHYRTVRRLRSVDARNDGFEIELLGRDAPNSQAHAAGAPRNDDSGLESDGRVGWGTGRTRRRGGSGPTDCSVEKCALGGTERALDIFCTDWLHLTLSGQEQTTRVLFDR